MRHEGSCRLARVSLVNVFSALASVIGADGKVHPDELSELVRSAKSEGLSDAEIEAVQRSSHEPLAAASLTPTERRFVYAIAYWLARVDGEMSHEEDLILGSIGKQLELADGQRMAVEALVDEVAATHTAFDYERLRQAIGKRLD
jgi:tellurite resistance protein